MDTVAERVRRAQVRGEPAPLRGGPLALLKTGDIVEVDVDARTINMVVSDAELAERRAAWKAPEERFGRGYGWMFSKHIRQANEGCDFDFLESKFGRVAPEPAIF